MIEISNLSKSFVTAGGTVDALRGINLTIRDGDIYGIIGMSGAGKSTLVRCINMLERPTEGTVRLDGVDLSALNKHQMQEMRHHVTMIFQSFNLLMQRNCLQNIMLPLKLTHVPRDVGQGACLSRSAFWRTAAAGGHRPGTGYRSKGPALR